MLGISNKPLLMTDGLTRQNVLVSILVAVFGLLAFFSAVEMLALLLLQTLKLFPEAAFSGADAVLFL